MTPLLDLKELKISSNCSEKTLTFLLCQCINVKEIYMGMMTCVSNQVWSDVLVKNSLCCLEHLKILKSSKVSNEYVFLRKNIKHNFSLIKCRKKFLYSEI